MNKVYVNKIANYGLHRQDIEIQEPYENTDSEKHFLGERYIKDLKINKNTDDIENKLISSNAGTIFDKSSVKTYGYERDDKGNVITNKDGTPKEIETKNNRTISENDNFSDDKTQLYADFDPTNTESGLYTEVFEQNSKNENGSTKQNIVEVKNSKFTTNLSSRSKPELNNKILSDRNASADVGNLLLEGNTIGNNPWQGENEFNAVMTSVDKQDEVLLDDIEENNKSDFGSALGNSAANLFENNIGVVKDAKNLFPKGTEGTKHPKGTSVDNKFALLQQAKSKNYKNIKMSSKIGTYNSLYNLLGSASGMFVGSLGKSAISNIADDMTSKFTGGFGIVGMIERLGGMVESMPSLEEIVALNLANYYNMYTARPGRIVTDRYRKYNFITPNTDDNLDGSSNGSSKNGALDTIRTISSKISDGINIASSWADGSKIANLVGKITNKKGQINDFDGRSNIISLKRGDLEVELKGEQFLISAGDFKKGGKSRFDDVRGNSKNTIENNVLGGLYIEPYYNPDSSLSGYQANGGLEVYTIPFQFNPNINDGGYEAKYNLEELMGRLLQIRSYVGTNSNTVTIETKYLATSPGKDGKDEEMEGKYSEWLKAWTPEVLYEIENKYRKLVMPYINKNVFVRPPIVRINLGVLGSSNGAKSDDVNKLFSYHNTENCFEVTKTLSEATSDKRYIVTNLIINPINQEGFDYYINYNKETNNFRRGFSVSLTLAETTKNFLDTVPNYYNYSKKIEKSFISQSNKNDNNKIADINTIPDLSCVFDIKYIEIATNEETEEMIKNVLKSTNETTDETTFDGTNNENRYNIQNDASKTKDDTNETKDDTNETKDTEQHIVNSATDKSFIKKIFESKK